MSSSDGAGAAGRHRSAALPPCSAPRSDNPDQVADADLRALIANAVRLYAAKAENGMRTPLPPAAAASASTRR